MDARRHRRFNAQFMVALESRDVKTHAMALDISRGGLMVSSPQPLEVGQVVRLRFSVGQAEEIELKGLVRHTAREGGFGVEFIEVLPDQQVRLSVYLEKVSAPPREASA